MSTIPKTIAFHTLGCKTNYSETSSISREIIKSGFEKVGYNELADIYVLNTCSVTENANKDARKFVRKAKRNNPNATIVVIGCYAQLKPDEIGEIDGVDMVLGAKEKFDLINHLDGLELNKGTKILNSKIEYVSNFKSSYSLGERTRSYLKVQDGCNYSCSFCTIPLARGKSRNDTIQNTIQVAKKIATTEVKEIVLTGINIGDYGNGSDESFSDLIKEMDSLIGIDRIRISSIEPNLLSNEIIELSASSKKLMPHFHIPLQSGSDNILKAMRRRYDTNLYSDLITNIKVKIPDVAIGVDVMVGFPGETESDFISTYNFIKKLDISYLHVFTYSERPNTDALNIDKIVSIEKRRERSKKLHLLSEQKLLKFYDQFIGQKRPVLFESIKNGLLIGHSDNYIKIRSKGSPDLINTIQNVELLYNDGQYVYGAVA
tara:strand:- start:3884 stop:5179 length:1296 start_codon:yes stop_codon:yes gene_type:complete